MVAYGACVQTHLPEVPKNSCAMEMEKLSLCLFAKVAKK